MSVPTSSPLPNEIGAALLRAADDALLGRTAGAGEVAAAALAQALGREVDGVLLYGSRARGAATPTSDVDALVFASGEGRGGLRGTSAGVDLDIEVVPASSTATLDPAAWFHVAPGVPLYDPTGAVAAFLARVEQHRARGPAPMKADEISRYRVWAPRMCVRIARNIATDPALAAYQSAWLLTTLLDLYFQIRALWTRSAKESLQYWADYDPPYRKLWDEYASAREPPTQLAILERLTEATFKGDGVAFDYT
jgi:hypothetical protein